MVCLPFSFFSLTSLLLIAKYTGSYGYPSDDQARLYCSCYRISIAAALTLIVLMHMLLFSSASTYSDNMHRSSAIFEPLEPQRGLVVRQSLLHQSSDPSSPLPQSVAEGYIHPKDTSEVF
jgi:hypothetical protein